MPSPFPRSQSLFRVVVARLVPTVLVTSTLLAARPAHAWSALAHMTIAAIAQTHLNDNAKEQIDKLLPLVTDPRSQDFLTAACWMDDMRGDGVRLYDHWHYDDIGFSPDGTPVGPRNTDNVAWAIDQNIKVLENGKVTDAEKARALRVILHSVGDAHCPVHCGSRYTKDHPVGDQGANSLRIDNFMGEKNLHALWDGGLGAFRAPQGDKTPREQREDTIRALAVTLTTNYPESSFPQSTNLDPEVWVQEGGAILKNDVYPANDTPDGAYVTKCRPIAEKQATLAGYRLARVLNSIWPPVGNPFQQGGF